QRFICAHSIMLALEGIPAFYIHRLLGTENDTEKFDNTRRKRAINRHTWQLEELNAKLADSQYHHRPLLQELKRLIAIRKRQPAFHPNVTQFTLHLGEKVFAFWRQSLRRDQSIFCISNITAEPRSVPLAEINLIDTHSWSDLIGGLHYDDLTTNLELQPYQTVWLSNCRY